MSVSQYPVLMTSTQASCREFLQQTIDAEIKLLEESLRKLKLRRNALQPISSLPPEIFAAIFSYLCLPGIPSLGGKPSRNRARLRITHVCHQWREIGLNQPQLWSHVNFETVSLAGATEILARAKSVPLYMEKRASGQHIRRHEFGLFLKEVQAHLPYTRHLSIRTEVAAVDGKICQELLSLAPAPTLEYLSLSLREDEHNAVDSTGLRQVFMPDIQVLGNLFGGSTPRLSCLKLRNCAIRWNSPLLKGLKHLEIVTQYSMERPTLANWLDTLGEIPQLKTLTLHSASPVAAQFPSNIERTVTLPSLTHLDISASLRDCALASTHLELPALTSLCLTSVPVDRHTGSQGVQDCLMFVVRHIHGPQDIQPLQSALIHNSGDNLQFLAWPVPDIDTLVQDPPAFLGATLPTRVKLSFQRRGTDNGWLEIFETMMAALPLDGLLTLAAVDLDLGDGLSQSWLRLFPNWPLLRRVRLGDRPSREFITALLKGDERCENLLLPSLTELALHGIFLDDWTLSLCNALMKRTEKGVPLETLDLRMSYRDSTTPDAVRLLSEIVVNVLRPLGFRDHKDTEESFYARRDMLENMRNMWKPLSPYPSCDDDSDDDDSEHGD